MKRLFAGILTVALILGCITTGVFAAGRNCPMAGIRRGCAYDRTQTVCHAMGWNRGANFIDANNDGVCDNRGAGFTDENNDGICDNNPAGQCAPKHTGRSHGGRNHGSRKGCHQ